MAAYIHYVLNGKFNALAQGSSAASLPSFLRNTKNKLLEGVIKRQEKSGKDI
jgi:hypothetical protein